MIDQATATRMLDEFQQEVQRTGYETCDKRTLTDLFGYLKIRCADSTLYGRGDKLKATLALEQRWQSDRKGTAILADHGEGTVGWNPAGTGKGSLTIHGIIKELRGLLVELPERITPPAPRSFPPLVAPGVIPASITDAALDASVARVLAQKRELASA
jgi:hypothetical protein